MRFEFLRSLSTLFGGWGKPKPTGLWKETIKSQSHVLYSPLMYPGDFTTPAFRETGPQVFKGQWIRGEWGDGDSGQIIIDFGGDRGEQFVEVRLHAGDAPELAQRRGEDCKHWVAEHMKSEPELEVTIFDTDKYGRTVVGLAYEFNGSKTDLVSMGVRNGWYWWYQHYAPDFTHLKDAQELARKERLGLWADLDDPDNQPQAPWDWRKAHRRGERPASMLLTAQA